MSPLNAKGKIKIKSASKIHSWAVTLLLGCCKQPNAMSKPPPFRAVEEAKARKLDQNYDLVQAYVGDQMTVLGRKFYIRQSSSPF